VEVLYTLVKSDGSFVSADSALEGKDLVLYYFSAHWCPPCRQFTPMLKDFYEVMLFKVFFVQSDTL
jgi:nucleoredoxin